MSESIFHIEKNTVQETLVIPLWGRKFASELYPDIYYDKSAAALTEKLDYDFSTLESKRNNTMFRFGYLESAVRYADMAMEIKEYLGKHPGAAVVNLGCGLDCTAENNAGADCKIYNIDKADVIDVRNKMLLPDVRTTNIGTDLNDTKWFDEIDDSKGAVFFAAGVFYYFVTDEIKALFCAMAKRFPGGRLVFDSVGKTGLKMMLKTWVKTAGITDIHKYFYLNDLTGLRAWLENADVSAKGYMRGYVDLEAMSIDRFFRFLSMVGDNMMKMRIVRIEFKA